MKYFKLAYDVFVSKLLYNILIILEIVALLVLTNTVVASYNSKKMLLVPYEELLTHKGLVAIMKDSPEFCFSDNEELQKNIEKHKGSVDYHELIEQFKREMTGVSDIIYSESRMIDTDDGAPSSLLYIDTVGRGINIQYVNHDIFCKLQLPLAAGRWPSSQLTKNGEIEIVLTGGTNAELDKVYETPYGKLKVVGFLTDTTYLPPGNNYPKNLTRRLSLFDLYGTFDTNLTINGLPTALADQQLFDHPDYFQPDLVWFIRFDDSTSDEDMDKNAEYLKQFSEVRTKFGKENFQTLAERSQQDLNDIYLRMLPIVLAAAVVVMAGIIGSVAMTAVRQKRNFGIYYLCGCQWKDCAKIITAFLTILFVFAAVLTAAAIGVMKWMNMDALIGSVYGWNNLLISMAELVLMYVLAALFPHHFIRSSSPVETIKNP